MCILECHWKSSYVLSSIKNKNRLLWSKISCTYQFDILWDYLKLENFDLHFLAMPRWESKYENNKFNFSWTLKKLFHVNLEKSKMGKNAAGTSKTHKSSRLKRSVWHSKSYAFDLPFELRFDLCHFSVVRW